jgi:hypothetical protein
MERLHHKGFLNPAKQAIWLVLTTALLMVGCGIFPEKVAIGDPRLQPLLKAASTFPRSQYGFSPTPTTGYVRLESRPRAGYDAMLHISGKTSRTMAFRKSLDGYNWIGEQEIFKGPNEYKTVDGTFKEQVCLTYEIEKISGFPQNRLNITYAGEDPRLAGRQNLSLVDVKPILKEWSY